MGALINRVADNWRPPFAIADAIGGDWPERIRQAAAALTPTDTETIGPMLLADIRGIFDDMGTDRIKSEVLAERLVEMEADPGPNMGRAGSQLPRTSSPAYSGHSTSHPSRSSSGPKARRATSGIASRKRGSAT